MQTLHIVYPELPPSSNKIYFQGTRLTKHSREYAERFALFMVRNHGHQINEMNPDLTYAVHLRFYFESLVNPGWLERDRTGQRKAKTRYKKIDVSNRIKLVEDCVRDALAIDDSHTFALSQEKHHDPSNPRVEIYVQPINPTLFGVPQEYLM